MQFHDGTVPSQQVLLQRLLMLMNAGHQVCAGNEQAVDQSDQQADQTYFDWRSNAFQRVEFVEVMFVVDHPGLVSQPGKDGEWQNGPVKAEDDVWFGVGIAQ